MPRKSRGGVDAGQLMALNRGWMERGIIAGSRTPLLALHKAFYDTKRGLAGTGLSRLGGGGCA